MACLRVLNSVLRHKSCVAPHSLTRDTMVSPLGDVSEQRAHTIHLFLERSDRYQKLHRCNQTGCDGLFAQREILLCPLAFKSYFLSPFWKMSLCTTYMMRRLMLHSITQSLGHFREKHIRIVLWIAHPSPVSDLPCSECHRDPCLLKPGLGLSPSSLSLWHNLFFYKGRCLGLEFWILRQFSDCEFGYFIKKFINQHCLSMRFWSRP